VWIPRQDVIRESGHRIHNPLTSAKLADLGAALRVAYLVSASTTGVLPKTPMLVQRGRLVLRFENGLKDLAGERVFSRLRQLARLIGREPVMEAR